MKINGEVTMVVTVEAMLKELKSLLDEYERKIKELERNFLIQGDKKYGKTDNV